MSECEAGHGRVERRRVWRVFEASDAQRWQHLHSVVVVERVFSSRGEQTRGVRFILSSLDGDARSFSKRIRYHWVIENQLHWCLDVTYGEDACRIRKDLGAHNLSMLRRLSLNLLR